MITEREQIALRPGRVKDITINNYF